MSTKTGWGSTPGDLLKTDEHSFNTETSSRNSTTSALPSTCRHFHSIHNHGVRNVCCVQRLRRSDALTPHDVTPRRKHGILLSSPVHPDLLRLSSLLQACTGPHPFFAGVETALGCLLDCPVNTPSDQTGCQSRSKTKGAAYVTLSWIPGAPQAQPAAKTIMAVITKTSLPTRRSRSVR